MLPVLATTADLQARKVDVSDGALAEVMLAAASDAVRDAAGCPIAQAQSTVSLPAPTSQWLVLPAGPVVGVSSVSVEGAPVSGYKLVGDKLWRACGWADSWEPSEVTVTYTHGLAQVPEDIVSLVCAFAAAGMLKAAEDYAARPAYLMSTKVDDFYEQYATDENALSDVFEIPPATREALRRRFGGGTYVTGSFE